MSKSQVERVKSSLVFRLNGKLFLRMLGIFVTLDLILLLLAGGWTLRRADNLGNEVAVLVEERGVPGPEATLWMETGDYRVEALNRPAQGQFMCWGVWWSLEPPLLRQERTTRTGVPYTIEMDLSGSLNGLKTALFCLLIWEGLALLLNLFCNAGTLSRTLRPIQELAAAASKLGSMTTFSHQELRDLAGKLDEINSSHLDRRIQVVGAQKEMTALTEAINAMLERIDRAYQSQARFVSDASHELRTPIAVVKGYADMLDRWGKKDPTALQEAIDAIKAESVTMQNLVEQLLFLARGDNNTTALHPEPFDLTAVASQLIKEAQIIDQTHTFEGRWETAVPIVADPALIKQAARVLIDNAVKYSPMGGQILVDVRLKEGKVAFSVEDEGQGVSAQDLPHIFERFYRTDESRTRQTGGTGLGLSIAKWIVERHGGSFEVVSRVGIGSRFTMLLPGAGECRAADGISAAPSA